MDQNEFKNDKIIVEKYNGDRHVIKVDDVKIINKVNPVFFNGANTNIHLIDGTQIGIKEDRDSFITRFELASGIIKLEKLEINQSDIIVIKIPYVLSSREKLDKCDYYSNLLGCTVVILDSTEDLEEETEEEDVEE